MKKIIKVLICIILLVGLLYCYMRFFETNNFRVKEYSIVDEELPNNFNGLKIIHFSDILYGRTTNISFIRKIVKEINILKPDIVIYTGDLYEGNIDILEKEKTNISNELSKINPSIDCYCISGDKDSDDYNTIMMNGGFTVIDNQSIQVAYKGSETITITNNFDEIIDGFNIGVIHKPDDIDKIDYNKLNIVLAGHSLNGQIRIPFYGALINRGGAKKYIDDYYMLGNTKFYISNGLGTKDISLRMNNLPSFNLYRIYNN